MTPTQFQHCRKHVLGLDQSQLSDMLGLHFRQVQRYERGITPIPPRITFAMAWLALHGAHNPWQGDGELEEAFTAPVRNGQSRIHPHVNEPREIA